MENAKPILYLPSYGRPENVKAFAENYNKTAAQIEVAVFLDSDDPKLPQYQELRLPATFRMIIAPSEGKAGAAVHLNRFFDLFHDRPVIGLVCDDVIPLTQFWDVQLVSHAFAHGYAIPHDSEFGIDFAPHFFLSTKFIKKVGSLNPLSFDHYGIDNFWFHLAKESGKLKVVPSVRFQHDRIQDETKQRFIEAAGDKDREKWKRFKNSHEWRELVKCCK